jgi:hypothetical protein
MAQARVAAKQLLATQASTASGLDHGASGPIGDQIMPRTAPAADLARAYAVIPIAGFTIIDAGTASSPPFQRTPKSVHHHAGIMFTFPWNSRSRYAGNRDHDGPEYAINMLRPDGVMKRASAARAKLWCWAARRNARSWRVLTSIIDILSLVDKYSELKVYRRDA